VQPHVQVHLLDAAWEEMEKGCADDLQLPFGRRLVAHRRHALRQDLSAQTRHRTLDHAQADCDAVHSE